MGFTDDYFHQQRQEVCGLLAGCKELDLNMEAKIGKMHSKYPLNELLHLACPWLTLQEFMIELLIYFSLLGGF